MSLFDGLLGGHHKGRTRRIFPVITPPAWWPRDRGKVTAADKRAILDAERERARKGAKRAKAYAAGLDGYHYGHRVAGVSRGKWCDDATAAVVAARG